jgi:putative transposase
VKYAFIQRHKLVWPISVQCRVLLVSVSGYHAHLARRVAIAQRRHLSDEALLVHISAVYAENRGAYGWPRIWRQLRAQGIRVGKQRVQRLMQKHGIQARGKRRFRVLTSDSKHSLPVAPNVLARKFSVGAPNQVWVGDLTYIPTAEGWLFLAVVIDLFSRKVVGWSMRPDMQRELVLDALDMAWLGQPRPANRADLPQRSWQPIRQRRLQSAAQEVWHCAFDESQRQLLGQRMFGDAVRFAEGGATARQAVSNHSRSQR